MYVHIYIYTYRARVCGSALFNTFYVSNNVENESLQTSVLCSSEFWGVPGVELKGYIIFYRCVLCKNFWLQVLCAYGTYPSLYIRQNETTRT